MARGGSRGGRGGRDRGPVSRDVLVSKKLSWLLRHGAEKEGLTLGRGGYVSLADVLSNRNIKSLQPRPTLNEIKEIVSTNSKQRFSLIHKSSLAETTSENDPDTQASTAPDLDSESRQASNPDAALTSTDPDAANYLIRANQGHSLAIADTSDLLTPITLVNAPLVVVHGTRRELWPAILASGGLKPMTRTHVHFARGIVPSLIGKFGEAAKEVEQGGRVEAGIPVDETSPDPDSVNGNGKGTFKEAEITQDGEEVRSGMRPSSTMLIFINLRKAMDLGVEFQLSQNGVVLSEGMKGSGVVPTGCFEKVVEKGGKVLMTDGTAA